MNSIYPACEVKGCHLKVCPGSDSDQECDGEFKLSHCGFCKLLVFTAKNNYCTHCMRTFCESHMYTCQVDDIDSPCRDCITKRPGLVCMDEKCIVCTTFMKS